MSNSVLQLHLHQSRAENKNTREGKNFNFQGILLSAKHVCVPSKLDLNFFKILENSYESLILLIRLLEKFFESEKLSQSADFCFELIHSF